MNSRRRNKRHERKPWPYQARAEYYRIQGRTQEIIDLLAEVQKKGLSGIRDPFLVKDSLPLIGSLARQIQNACHSYDTKRQTTFARWAGWAVQEIDILAAAIIHEMDAADRAFNAKCRNIYIVQDAVRAAIDLAPRIIGELSQGPKPPEEAESAVDQMLDVAAEAWDDDEPEGRTNDR